jgi:all-beta uncharacterized protein
MNVGSLLARYRCRFLCDVILAAVATAATACGSTSTSFIGPSGPKCEVSATNNTPDLPAAGGSGSVTVNTSRDCLWSASADASWLSLSTVSGQGAATLNYSAAPNSSGTPRHGRLVVAQQSLDVTQAAAPCRYGASPETLNFDEKSHDASVSLTVTDGCSWTVRTDANWIGDPSPASGVGSGTITFTVAANGGPARNGSLTVGNATVRVNQAAAASSSPAPVPPPNPTPQPVPSPTPTPTPSPAPTPAPSPAPSPAPTPTPTPTPTCSYSIKPTYYNSGKGPDDIIVNVTTGSSCTWTTSTNASWVTIESGRTGTGTGTVRLVIPANAGPPRSTIVTVAGNPLTLTQEGPCVATIKPRWYDAGRGPDDILISVTADAACSWKAASTVPWVTVTDGATGTGNGTVRLLVQPNSGPARSVTLTIAGQPFDLRQFGSQ